MSDMDGIESTLDKTVDKITSTVLEIPADAALQVKSSEAESFDTPTPVEDTATKATGPPASSESMYVDKEEPMTKFSETSDPLEVAPIENAEGVSEPPIEKMEPEAAETEHAAPQVPESKPFMKTDPDSEESVEEPRAVTEEPEHTAEASIASASLSETMETPIEETPATTSVIEEATESVTETVEGLLVTETTETPDKESQKHVTGAPITKPVVSETVPVIIPEIEPEVPAEAKSINLVETILHDNFEEGKDVAWDLEGTDSGRVDTKSNSTHAYDINDDFANEKLREPETPTESSLPWDTGATVSEKMPWEEETSTDPMAEPEVTATEPAAELEVPAEEDKLPERLVSASNGVTMPWDEPQKANVAPELEFVSQAPSETMPWDEPASAEAPEQVTHEEANGHTAEPELDFLASAPTEAMPWDRPEATSDSKEAHTVEPELDFLASAPAEAMPWDQPKTSGSVEEMKEPQETSKTDLEHELDFAPSAAIESMPWKRPESATERSADEPRESSTAECELDFLSSAPAEAMPWDQPKSTTIPTAEQKEVFQETTAKEEEEADKFDFLEEDDDILWDDVMDDDLLDDEEVEKTPVVPQQPLQTSRYAPTTSFAAYTPARSVSPTSQAPPQPAQKASAFAASKKKTDAYDFPADILPQKPVARPSATNIYASHTAHRPPSVTGSIDQALSSKPQTMAPPPAKTVKKKQSFFEELPITPSFAKHIKHPVQDPYALIETHRAQENAAVPPSADLYRSRASTVKNPYAPPSFDKNAKARSATPSTNQHARNMSISSASSRLSTVDVQIPPNPYAPQVNKYAPPQPAHVPEALQMPPNPAVPPFPQGGVLSPAKNQYQTVPGYGAPVTPIVPAMSVNPPKESSFAAQYNPSNKYSPYVPNGQTGNVYGIVSPTQMSFPNGHQSKASVDVDVSDLMPKPTISSKPVSKKNMPPPKKLYGRGPSASFGSHGGPQVDQQYPTGLQLLGQRQFPIFHFSASSKVAKLVPKIDPYGNMISGVVVEDVALNVATDASLQSFPGPLVKGRTKKKDLEKWIAEKISSLESVGDLSGSLLLWKVVGVIASSVNKPGDFSSPEFHKQVVAVINPAIDVKPDEASINFNELTNILRAQVNKLSNAHKANPQTMAVVHQLLQDGEKQRALLAALHEHDWAMALLIANLIGPAMFAEVIRLYTEANFGKQNPVEQGLRFFLRSSQLSVESMSKDDKEWLASNFASALPFIILNHPAPSTLLIQLGEMFTKTGFPEQSIVCYMLSGLPFIPSEELQLTFDTDLIIVQEIYEYVLLSSQNVPANLVNGFPHLVQLKLVHAEVLDDFGFIAESKRYADHISSVVKSRSLPVSPKVAYSLQQLMPRLSQSAVSDGGWFGSKIARPNLDRVWGQLDKSFSKFVAGEDINNNANNGGENVFSKFSPAVSRTQSVVDLQTQATSSAPGVMYASPMSNRQPEMAMPNTPYSAPTIGSDQTTIAQSQGYSFPAPSSQQITAPPPARPPLLNSLSAAPRYAPSSVPASFSTSPESKKAALHSSAVDLYQQSLASKSFHDLPSVSTPKKPSRYAPYGGIAARPMPVAENYAPQLDNTQISHGPSSIASAAPETEQVIQHPLPNRNFHEQIPVSPTLASGEMEIKKSPESGHEVEVKKEPVDDIDALSAHLAAKMNIQEPNDIRTSTPPDPVKAPAKKKSAYNPYAPHLNSNQQNQKKPNPYAPVMSSYKPAEEEIKVKEEPVDYLQQDFDFYSYGGYHVPEPIQQQQEEKPEDEQQDEPMAEHSNNFGPMEDDYTAQDPDVDLDKIESTHAFNPMENAGYNNFGPASSYSPPVFTPQPESSNYDHQDDQFVDDVVEDEDEDDEMTEKKEEKRDDNINKKGWFSWLGKKSDEPKAIKAKLGEESAFYYDENLKRWVNKNAPPEEQAASGPPPPPAMKRKPAGDSSASAAASPSPAPPSKTVSPAPPSSTATPPAGRPPVKKADSDIDGLLNMAAASGTRKTKRGPRRGYVDVMNK